MNRGSASGSSASRQAARRCRRCRADAIIIIPVRGMTLFPGRVLPITVGRPRSVAAAQRRCASSARSAS